MTAAVDRRLVCPIALVRLRLRFEDYVGAVPAAILPPGWGTPAVMLGPGAWSELATGPFVAMGVVAPSEARVSRTSPREPSTADISIPWRALPIDPRVLRAVGIEIFAAAVTPDVLQRWREMGVPPFAFERTKLQFIGLADKWSFDDEKQELSISGRDFTGILLDAKLSAAAAQLIDLRWDLVMVCQALLASAIATAGMRAVWAGDPALMPPVRTNVPLVRMPMVSTTEAPADGGQVVSLAPTPISPTPPSARMGATRASQRADGWVPYVPAEDDDVSLWDAITDLTVQAGCVAWVDLDRVVIAPGRNVFGGSRVVSFVRAKNCRKLRFSRDLGRRNVPAVEVRCWNSDLKTRLIARYPVTSAPSDEDVIKVVSGTSALPTLLQVAEALYYELRRQQMGGALQTRSMSAVGFDDGGLLDIHSGDAIDVQPALAAWDASDLSDLPLLEVQQRLIDAGITGNVAAALAEAAHRRILTTFWVRRADHRWSSRDGYQLTVDFTELPTITIGAGGQVLRLWKTPTL